MIAVVFPGQGSQVPGMGKDLFESHSESKAVFDAVQLATGTDIASLCFDSDEETLRQTQNAQLALFTCGIASYEALKANLPTEHFLAGHSVGEYAAVVASGALFIEQGAKLVQIRGNLMASAGSERPGGMAAVLGLEREKLESVCQSASQPNDVVVIANDNCPGQLVISGDKTAVERASGMASEAGAKRVLPLKVSGAFHSPLMLESARKMGEALRGAAWNEQKLIVFANVTASPIEHGMEWANLFEKQLLNPVRWTETIQNMSKEGVDTIIECGPGEVLCGLARRTDPSIRTLKVGDSASLQSTILALQSEAIQA